MNKLGTHSTLQEQVTKCLQEENSTTYELLEKILEEWAYRSSTVASLDKLVYVLKKSDLADAAEKLRIRYCTRIIENIDENVPIKELIPYKILDCGLVKIVCSETKISYDDLQPKRPHHTVELTDSWLCPKHQGVNFALRQTSILLQIFSIFVSVILLMIFFLPRRL